MYSTDSDTPLRRVKETWEVEHRTAAEKLRTKFHPTRPSPNDFNSVFARSLALGSFDGRKPVHTVLKVALRSGELVAVDLACAHVGHLEPILPWKEFEASRVLNIIEVTKVRFSSSA